MQYGTTILQQLRKIKGFEILGTSINQHTP